MQDQSNIQSRVYIAGAGVISAIGNNVQECLASLEKGEAGMGAITMLDTIHRNQIPVAEVKLSNEALAVQMNVSPLLSRTALLSMTAAKEALQPAHIPYLSNLRTGVRPTNKVGGIAKSEQIVQT